MYVHKIVSKKIVNICSDFDSLLVLLFILVQFIFHNIFDALK